MFILDKDFKNEDSHSYVTEPDDFKSTQSDNVEKKQDETHYAWLDDFGWI